LIETGEINQLGQNQRSAFLFYEYASKNGLPVAQNNLGISYQNGDGVLKNIDAAANWFYKAL